MSQALIPAGTVEVEVRLQQAIDYFAADLDDSQRAKFRTLRKLAPPTVSEVIRLTEELNRDGSRLHRAWRPYGTRLVSILEKIRLFTKAGDVLVGGSQNMIASGVWAVVRTGLQCATNSLSYFEKVSELFMRIGRLSSVQQDTVALFPECLELQHFMCEYLITVLTFCRSMVRFSKKSTLAQLTASMGNSVDPECKEFETNVALWSRLIDTKVQNLSIRTQLASQQDISRTRLGVELLTSSKARKKALEERTIKALERLSPLQDQFDIFERHERKKGSVQWIYNSAQYVKWKKSQRETSVLWIQGILGSGKTVLMANIVADLQATAAEPGQDIGTISRASGPPIVVASFFCQYNRAETLTSEVIFGSIAHQIIRQIDNDAATKIVNHFDETDADPDNVIKLLSKYLPRHTVCFVVIDALDECSLKIVKEVMGHLKGLASAVRLQLCCSGRTGCMVEVVVGKIIGPVVIQAMAEADRRDEMQHFIVSELERRRDIRLVDDKTLNLLKQALVSASQGMYLWVALQIETLFPEHTQAVVRDADIIEVLDSLHDDLRKTFDRALSRIPDRELGKKAFHLVSGAARPLQGDEFRIALNVRPGDTSWDQHSLPRDTAAAVYSLGGGLLEVEEEDDTIHFIHHSALQHLLLGKHNEKSASHASENLVRNLWATTLMSFEESDAHNTLAEICTTYLNYEYHERQVSKNRAVIVDASKATDLVQAATVSQGGTPGKVFAAIMRNRPSKSQPLDIVRALEEYRDTRPQTDDVLLFAPYASEYWLQHTRRYRPNGTVTAKPFQKLIFAQCPHAKQPWRAGMGQNPFEWAIYNGHVGIYAMLLSCYEGFPGFEEEAIGWRLGHWRTPERCRNPDRWQIRGQDLGNIVAHLVADAPPEYDHILIVLLSLEADPNLPLCGGGSNESPLTIELRRMVRVRAERSSSPFKRLLWAKADPNILVGERETPLVRALKLGMYEVAEDLLNHGANFELSPAPPAILRGKTLTLRKLLLDGGADPNETSPLYGSGTVKVSHSCPLFDAIGSRNEESVQMLLTHNTNVADPNISVDGYRPLMLALVNSSDSQTIPRLLLKHGADPNQRSRADGEYASRVVLPLDYARARDWADVVQMLVDNRANVSLAVAEAVGNGDLHRFRFWSDYTKGRALDQLIGEGEKCETFVQHAARHGYDAILKELLAQGYIWRPGLESVLDLIHYQPSLKADFDNPLILAIRARQRACASSLISIVRNMTGNDLSRSDPLFGLALREAVEVLPSDVGLFELLRTTQPPDWDMMAPAVARAVLENDSGSLKFWLDMLIDRDATLHAEAPPGSYGEAWYHENKDKVSLATGESPLRFALRMRSDMMVMLLFPYGMGYQTPKITDEDIVFAVCGHLMEPLRLMINAQRMRIEDERARIDRQRFKAGFSGLKEDVEPQKITNLASDSPLVNPLLAAIQVRAWSQLELLVDAYLDTVWMFPPERSREKTMIVGAMVMLWPACRHRPSGDTSSCKRKECTLRDRVIEIRDKGR